jgi:mannose-6-phosphate isomerase-like protein (cupin superfamily)
MKRRSLLTGAVALGTATVLSPFAPADIVRRGVRVAAGQDRFSQPSPLGGSRAIDCKVSSKDTNRGWCSFDSLWQAKGGPPLHVPHQQEEWFYVVEGDFVFQIGAEKFRIAAGDSVLAPRKIPHGFTHVRDERGKIVSVFQPAGEIEAFFHEYGKLGDASTEAAKRLYRAHGRELLGPPLNVVEMLQFFQS